MPDGTYLDPTTCAVGTLADSGPTTVRCTGFAGISSIGTNYGGPAVGAAVLGTVDEGAVTALDGGPTNPYGAEHTTMG